MWRNHTTFAADEAKPMSRAREFLTAPEVLFLDMAANAVLASTIGLGAIRAGLRRELIEPAVGFDFMLQEAFQRHLDVA